MKKITIFWATIIILFILNSFIEMGIFLPKKYCIGNICIQRPSMYTLKVYSDVNKNQSGYCVLSFNCTQDFKLKKNGYQTLLFKSIFDNSLGIVINQVKSKKYFPNLTEYHKCNIYKDIDFNTIKDEYSTTFFLKDTNYMVLLTGHDKNLIEKTFDDICLKPN